MAASSTSSTRAAGRARSRAGDASGVVCADALVTRFRRMALESVAGKRKRGSSLARWNPAVQGHPAGWGTVGEWGLGGERPAGQETGMLMTWPTRMRLGSVIDGFAARIWSTVTPNLSAILESVSPATMT